MNDQNLQQEIQQKVLERIKSGKVRMHPRAYFVVQIIVTLAVAVLALALSVFVLSFIIFSIHGSGEQFLLGFGSRGVATFLMLFPWVMLIIDLAIIFLLEWLLQGFKLGYRISLLSVFLGVFILSALLAVIVDLTPIHQVLLGRADEGDLPIIGQLYESIRDSHEGQGIFRGTIVSIQGNEITITHNDGDHDADDGTRTVILPQDAPQLQIGDRVYVYGNGSGDQIQAYGIELLSPDQ